MNFERNGSTITLFPEGEITSANAAAWEEDVFQTLGQQSFSTLILNAAKIPYISSAGLRVVLKLKKTYQSFSVVDLTPDVWDIFSITGFTEIMDCRRVLRCISVENAELIGEGEVGRVYRLDADTIVKVYKHGTPEEIRQEMNVAKGVFRLGVPTAIPYDIVRIGDEYGTVYEMLGSECPRTLISHGDERLDYVVEKYSALLHDLHSVSVAGKGFEDVKKSYFSFLEGPASMFFTDPEREKMIALIRSVPDADTLLHNDLHLGNVLSRDDEWMIIDLDDIAMGHPAFDLGSIYATYCAFYETGHPGEEDRADMEDFHRISWETGVRMRHDLLRRYYPGISEEKAAEVEKILAFIGYVRLLAYLSVRPGFTADVPKIANAVQRLKELLVELDTLAYEV